MMIVLVPLLSALGTVAILAFGRKWLLDHPNERSSHVTPTPRGGGIGVVVGFLVGIWIVGDPVLRLLVVPVGAMAVLSLVDDLRELPAGVRLVVQALIAAGALALLGAFRIIPIPPLLNVVTSLPLLLLSLLWVVGLANSYNFLDGIDGIATVQAIVAGAFWWLIGRNAGVAAVQWGGGLLALTCVGFLPFNWQPARIFLGDVGSATIGFVLALLPLVAANFGDMRWAAPVGVLLVWPFLFDSWFTILRRMRRRENLLDAHRSHLYQRLIIAGWSHRRVTCLYGGMAVVAGIAATRVAVGEWLWGWIAALALAAVLVATTSRVEGRW